MMSLTSQQYRNRMEANAMLSPQSYANSFGCADVASLQAGRVQRGIQRTFCAVFAALLIFLGAAVLMAVIPDSAYAEPGEGAGSWTVTYPAEGGKLVDDFSKADFQDVIRDMQPGDDITFTVNLVQEFAEDSDWYMSNEVLKTLEEGARAANNPEVYSAYTYILTYIDPNGKSTTLYDSSTVGRTNDEGDYNEGLMGATEALDEFFFLDTLKKGETAHVELYILLDGETEQNAYFDTLAQVKMKFAVETTTGSNKTGATTGKSPGRGAVQTGDPNDLFPYYVAMLVSGLLLLLLAVDTVRRRRKQAQEAQVQRGGHAR